MGIITQKATAGIRRALTGGAINKAHQDYISNWRFVVNGDGFNSTAFSAVSFPSPSTKYTTYREGGHNFGSRDFFDGFDISGSLTLARALSKNMDLVNWAYSTSRLFKKIQYPYKKNISIDMYTIDNQSEAALVVDLFGVKPISYGTGNLDAVQGNLVVERINCRVEGMMIKKISLTNQILSAVGLVL